MTMLGTAAGGVRLRLVGTFELSGPDVPLPVGPATQRLLAYLALSGRAVRRSVVAGTLGLDSGEPQAAARLRSALWRVPRPGGVPLVDASGDRLQLATAVRVDYRETERAGVRADADALREDLLPDWDDDWVVVERERYRQTRLHALERLCARHRSSGDYGAALHAGLLAVGSEPLRESAHRQVVATHLAEGNPAEALRQYETFRRLLRTELGLPPSPAIRALLADLLGRPADMP
ncbi:MAG TPA: BTAD domain-containing putative transcriptional regulator [Mycobacteriales bacterium]|jgi:DNA-binding SARP family transcriptional activator|nr:BTAD domain-containing putative transcriptional regulator [Mycobacteriales bacterium]